MNMVPADLFGEIFQNRNCDNNVQWFWQSGSHANGGRNCQPQAQEDRADRREQSGTNHGPRP